MLGRGTSDAGLCEGVFINARSGKSGLLWNLKGIKVAPGFYFWLSRASKELARWFYFQKAVLLYMEKVSGCDVVAEVISEYSRWRS